MPRYVRKYCLTNTTCFRNSLLRTFFVLLFVGFSLIMISHFACMSKSKIVKLTMNMHLLKGVFEIRVKK